MSMGDWLRPAAQAENSGLSLPQGRRSRLAFVAPMGSAVLRLRRIGRGCGGAQSERRGPGQGRGSSNRSHVHQVDLLHDAAGWRRPDASRGAPGRGRCDASAYNVAENKTGTRVDWRCARGRPAARGDRPLRFGIAIVQPGFDQLELAAYSRTMRRCTPRRRAAAAGAAPDRTRPGPGSGGSASRFHEHGQPEREIPAAARAGRSCRTDAPRPKARQVDRLGAWTLGGRD